MDKSYPWRLLRPSSGRYVRYCGSIGRGKDDKVLIITKRLAHNEEKRSKDLLRR